ncbi:hypothetical protein [Streptomyces albidoflavus]|uniref:hypothetical protein n=1 Tax=Streptomyces albidoflavus TaxID=1886 RepID=UPI00101F1CD7|nr:hypothetical protein [Streptomyces albidoflavus]RZD78228.1 hypothetical protein C0Q61_14410 [Streptomyces albidoflavus]RZE14555.1 hypothetical protein C0Q66_00065 [Streptomyces albidoflavus]
MLDVIHPPLGDLGLVLSLVTPYAGGVAPVVMASWLGRKVHRARRARAALADRLVVELIPTSTFDPSEAEVARWARQLGRVHHAAAGVPARGSAARLRYSAENGKMRCYLEGPRTAQAVLAMPGFAEVEVRAQEDRTGIRPVRFPAPEGPA